MLKADKRAGGNVLGAPIISGSRRDGIGVDGVWVVILNRRLSSREASEGGNAEGENRTHGDDGGSSRSRSGDGGCGVGS